MHLLGLYSLLFNAAPIAGVVFEVTFGSKDEDPTFLYVIQGLIVFAIGFDALMNAALEFMTARPVKLGAQCGFYKETIISIIVVPTLWLLLCAAILSSHAYDCTAFPCRSKHYVYPVPYSLPAPDSLAARCLPVFYLLAASGAVLISESRFIYVPLCIRVSHRHRRETLRSVVPCRQSMFAASTVFLLFLCFLLTSSAIATLMLQGVYSGGDYYQDNQYVPLRARIQWYGLRLCVLQVLRLQVLVPHGLVRILDCLTTLCVVF